MARKFKILFVRMNEPTRPVRACVMEQDASTKLFFVADIVEAKTAAICCRMLLSHYDKTQLEFDTKQIEHAKISPRVSRFSTIATRIVESLPVEA